MMAASRQDMSVMERLPEVRGAYTPNADIARFTWFRTGGPADVLYQPADTDDLRTFMAGCPADIPVMAIGVGSNMLVRDGGVRGVVIRLGRPFAGVEVSDDRVAAGAAAVDVSVAAKARDASLSGLEFLSGIPGTIGGAVRMNAGAYDVEVKDVLVSAEIVERSGERREAACGDLGFGYRHSDIAADAVVVSAVFQGSPGERRAIAARMDEIRQNREDSQPLRTRTGGSTFRNPDGHKAWKLIEAAGCRGLMRGAAQVSEKHCNFLINTGGATGADIEGLGEEVRRRVLAETGVTLEWEIRRIGEPDPDSGPKEISS